MAAFDPTTTIRKIESFIASRPEFSDVMVGDPKAPFTSKGLGAAIFMDSQTIAELMLDGNPLEIHYVAVRVYSLDAFMGETPDEWELQLLRAVGLLQAALWGDFDLGGTLRTIDLAGEHGRPMSVEYGYVDVGGQMHRDETLKAWLARGQIREA